MAQCEICKASIGEGDHIYDVAGRYWHRNCLEVALANTRTSNPRHLKYLGSSTTTTPSCSISVNKGRPTILIALRPPIDVEKIDGYRDGGTCAFHLVDSEGLTIGCAIDPKGRMYIGAPHDNDSIGGPLKWKKLLSLDSELLVTLLAFLEGWLPPKGPNGAANTPAESYLRPALERLRRLI